ncbi:MAG: hypothetical protein ACP5SH_09340 [Syntrophobacteraceae bacterium]
MVDRLYLKVARKSLKEIHRSVEAGRHTLAGILERADASADAGGQPSAGSFFAGILGRLVVLEKELKNQIWEIENLGVKALEANAEKRPSGEQIAKYGQINGRLAAIEKRIKKDFERLLPQCEQMRKEGVIDDFEIEAEVSLWLDENDPAFRGDDDNILAVVSFDAKSQADSDFGLDDRQNHNEYQFFDGHAMQKERHCWLFHEFFDHGGLWDDIVRADMIWLDVRVTYQNFYHSGKDATR